MMTHALRPLLLGPYILGLVLVLVMSGTGPAPAQDQPAAPGDAVGLRVAPSEAVLLTLQEPMEISALPGLRIESKSLILLRLSAPGDILLFMHGARMAPVWMLDEQPLQFIGNDVTNPVLIGAAPADPAGARLWAFDPNLVLRGEKDDLDNLREALATAVARMREGAIVSTPLGRALPDERPMRIAPDDLFKVIDELRQRAEKP